MSDYIQIGPFVYGDPRFLAGGSCESRPTYDSRLPTSCDEVVPTADPTDCLFQSMVSKGQAVSKGKSGYHGNYATNMFVKDRDLDMPTVGVEIETIMKNMSPESAQKFTRSVYSNWFHAENDGSLDNAHGGTYGYELVSTVLPARHYRNVDLWAGFQNLVSPLLKSYSSSETGLHVHVGMSWFENTKLPAMFSNNIRAIGKCLTSKIYYTVLPRTFSRKVFLRGSDLHYCHETYNWALSRPQHAEDASGYRMLDETVSDLMLDAVTEYTEVPMLSRVAYECSRVALDSNYGKAVKNALSSGDYRFNCSALPSGHDTEVNAGHEQTLEFRRGKGTVNALSIHRMIEMCVMTVLYAGHVIDNPSEIVSSKNLLAFVIENTNSNALKSLAEKELAKCV